MADGRRERPKAELRPAPPAASAEPRRRISSGHALFDDDDEPPPPTPAPLQTAAPRPRPLMAEPRAFQFAPPSPAGKIRSRDPKAREAERERARDYYKKMLRKTDDLPADATAPDEIDEIELEALEEELGAPEADADEETRELEREHMRRFVAQDEARAKQRDPEAFERRSKLVEEARKQSGDSDYLEWLMKKASSANSDGMREAAQRSKGEKSSEPAGNVFVIPEAAIGGGRMPPRGAFEPLPIDFSALSARDMRGMSEDHFLREQDPSFDRSAVDSIANLEVRLTRPLYFPDPDDEQLGRRVYSRRQLNDLADLGARVAGEFVRGKEWQGDGLLALLFFVEKPLFLYLVFERVDRKGDAAAREQQRAGDYVSFTFADDRCPASSSSSARYQFVRHFYALGKEKRREPPTAGAPTTSAKAAREQSKKRLNSFASGSIVRPGDPRLS